MTTTNFLAIDIGASSGRVILGQWDGQRFALHELHRFANGPVAVRGHLYWDVLRLWQEIQTGIARYAAQYDAPPAGIGIDTWAVDFALLDGAGELLGNPYHYRDRRTAGLPAAIDQRVPPARLFAQTGIQRLPINTLYQLASMRQSHDPQLAAAHTLLLIPDLFGYWLTGRAVAEYTNATTTQLYNPSAQAWARELLEALDLPGQILPPIVAPGTILGALLPAVGDAVGLRHAGPVIATATHDTASAVAAVPGLDEQSAYISSGTWSLVGVEIAQPILSARAQALNFTNEGGVGGMIRLLKNVAGLWLLQECQRQWARAGQPYTWAALLALAEQAPPWQSVVDPDAAAFLNPDDMPATIRDACRRSGQPEPASAGALVRCCLESLALKYRWALQALEELTGRRLATVRIVGGGSQNALLCQITADACRREVVAGPVEATALGNILVQAVATGHLGNIAAGRQAVATSLPQTRYAPHPDGAGDAAAARFDALLAAGADREGA
ncbi:MAG TPA: rhamnulokinase family protein [Chloroflexia bacterium]|nr:rhamnulokinase family protein [Chloroflexia bacterium]